MLWQPAGNGRFWYELTCERLQSRMSKAGRRAVKNEHTHHGLCIHAFVASGFVLSRSPSESPFTLPLQVVAGASVSSGRVTLPPKGALASSVPALVLSCRRVATTNT